MSWGAQITIVDGEFTVENASGLDVPEHQEQFDAAKQAIEALVDAVGGREKKYKVNISGHGNPEHEPKSGWANDFISIVISQV